MGMELIIQLIAGLVGGNAAGAAMKNLSLGTIGNSIAGILGGGAGGLILSQLGLGGAGEAVAGAAEAAGGLDIGGIIQNVAGGGVGGGVVMAIVGIVKKMLVKA